VAFKLAEGLLGPLVLKYTLLKQVVQGTKNVAYPGYCPAIDRRVNHFLTSGCVLAQPLYRRDPNGTTMHVDTSITELLSKAPCVSRQDDEDNYDWDYDGNQFFFNFYVQGMSNFV
jgi:hypothetical protein